MQSQNAEKMKYEAATQSIRCTITFVAPNTR